MKRWLAPLFLVLAILVPYFRLTTMQSIVVTDDRILSDVFNAELPARVEMARLLRGGELPLWTPRMCTGHPLIAGMFPDPLSVLTFVPLPRVAALNVFVLTTLIIAALGAYAFARRLGASTAGATLSGLSFSWSGFMVCQLKHLGIVATVCWLPIGMLLLDRALTDPRSLRLLAPFALIVTLQWISNFPQSAYICTVVYAAYALALSIAQRRGTLLLAAVAAIVLGVAGGAAALLPLRELADLSDRGTAVSFEYATMLPYSPRDALMFLFPYAHGDVSDGSYRGPGLFWESYGYVGVLTVLLAGVGAWRRDARTVFLVAIGVLSFLIVLGPATPFFKLVFHTLPGMKTFRFPTRWLVVVELSLAVLGGLGLTALEKRLRHVGWAAVAITTFDLVFHQMRQNAFADARAWLTPPATAGHLHGEERARIYSPLHYQSHSSAYGAARGWADLSPYYAHRELIQPNTNLLWDLDTADCYAGLLPSTSSRVWGEHGWINQNTARRGATLALQPPLRRLLELNGVGYVLSPWTTDLPEAFRAGDVAIYRSAHLPRAYVVASAVVAKDLEDAIQRTLDPALDARTTVVLEGATATSAASHGEALIVSERSTAIEIVTASNAPGWLVLADQWYPGWRATIDGAEVPIARANGRHRAIAIPAGAHRARFFYQSMSLRRGAIVSVTALLVVLGVYLVLRRRERA